MKTVEQAAKEYLDNKGIGAGSNITTQNVGAAFISGAAFAQEQAKAELEELKISLQKIDPVKAEIFSAHQEIVDDITINDEIPARIQNDLWSGDYAIFQVYQTVITVLRQTLDPLISERAEDFDDVRALLLRLWHGEINEGLSEIRDPVIIAAHDLKPSDTVSLDKIRFWQFLRRLEVLPHIQR